MKKPIVPKTITCVPSRPTIVPIRRSSENKKCFHVKKSLFTWEKFLRNLALSIGSNK